MAGYGAGAQPYQDQAVFAQNHMPDMTNIAAPTKARKMAAAAPKQNDDEDEGWGDAGALLD